MAPLLIFLLGVQSTNIRTDICLRQQNKAQNKHDSANHNGGSCASSQALDD